MQKAIKGVGAEVPEAAYRYGAPLPVGDEEQARINQACPYRVQGMIVDAATVWIEDRAYHQMIQINGYGRYHDKPCLPPVFFPEQFPEGKGQQQMKPIVDAMPEYVKCNVHGHLISRPSITKRRRGISAALSKRQGCLFYFL